MINTFRSTRSCSILIRSVFQHCVFILHPREGVGKGVVQPLSFICNVADTMFHNFARKLSTQLALNMILYTSGPSYCGICVILWLCI